MTTSAFWYTPHPLTEVVPTQQIDLGEVVSDLQINPYRISKDAISWNGRRSWVNMRPGMRVRIIQERFTDTALAEKLYNMGDHLERGNAVAFAVDKTKTFCAFGELAGGDGFTTGSLKIYDITIGPLFTGFSSADPAAGDVLLAQSFGPDAKREECRVGSYSDGRLTLSSELKFNHSGQILFRHRDFFPGLYRRASDNETTLLTSDHRITYTWDATLEEYASHLAGLGEGNEDVVDTDGLDSVLESVGGAGSVGSTISSGAGGGFIKL